MKGDIVQCGYNGKVVIKGDQEPAIEDLLKEVARARGDEETIVEWSPVRDSSANGLAEKGAQTLECLVRTHLLELDQKLGVKLSLNHPWFSWLVEHCADMHNRYQVGHDGSTLWERVKRRRFHWDAIEFGRRVVHPIPGKSGGLM